MVTKLQFVFFLIFILFAVSACEPIGTPEATQSEVITTVTEAKPEPVVVYGVSFETPPEKIVCLSPAITEIFYEIYRSDKLVGVGEYCDYPPEALTEKVNCGSAANPDFDTIISLAPDVLITQSPLANKDITRLKNAGITLLNVPAATDILELGRLYNEIGMLFRNPLPEGEVPDAGSLAMPGQSELFDDVYSSDISLGKFVYYLSDDFTAAGSDTFPGNFFGEFGNNLCDGVSAEMPPDEISPKTVILPAYLSHFADDYFADTSSRVIILTEEATKLLERPTTRVRFVLDELRESDSSTETTAETEATEET
ncbi:MAG: helical backbone metal receptor [Ruminococcus sp.]|jgi:hypothetical protein|nr:helical backbone metal receptor [Ruminococcus sp.]